MEAEHPAGPARWRRALPWALVGLAAIVLLASTLTVWVKRQALDTNAWADASGELIQDPETRAAVSSYLVEQAFSGGDAAARVVRALPPELAPLAPALSAALSDVARRLAQEILSRPRVQAVWIEANRAAHRTFLDVVDEREGTLTAEGNAVVLDLRPLVTELAGRLGVADRLAPDAGRIRIAEAGELDQIRRAVRAVRALSQLLTLLAVALGVAAVWTAAPGRRRAVLMGLGGAMVIVALVLMTVRRLAGDHVVDVLADGAGNRPVAANAWLVGTSLVRDVAVSVLAYGVLVIAVCWLAGMSRHAVAARRWAAPRLRTSPWGAGAVAAAAGLALLAWGPGAGDRRLLGVVVLIALLAVAVAALWRQTLREFPVGGPGPSRSTPY